LTPRARRTKRQLQELFPARPLVIRAFRPSVALSN
jgi:hypothetical protein